MFYWVVYDFNINHQIQTVGVCSSDGKVTQHHETHSKNTKGTVFRGGFRWVKLPVFVVCDYTSVLWFSNIVHIKVTQLVHNVGVQKLWGNRKLKTHKHKYHREFLHSPLQYAIKTIILWDLYQPQIQTIKPIETKIEKNHQGISN